MVQASAMVFAMGVPVANTTPFLRERAGRSLCPKPLDVLRLEKHVPGAFGLGLESSPFTWPIRVAKGRFL